MFTVTIALAAILFPSLEAIIVDSYYMPATPKELVHAFVPNKVNNQQTQYQPLEKSNEVEYEDPYPTAKPLYKYGYSVFDPYTMDVKSQWEHRDGDVVRGAYNMLEPDGSLRIVEYSSDKDTGFRAIVKKIPFYMDMSRRPVETFTNLLNPSNQQQEVQPATYNEPLINPHHDQPSIIQYSQPSHPNQANHQHHNEYRQHHSENYAQREKYHKHHHNKQKNHRPIDVYKRLLPILR